MDVVVHEVVDKEVTKLVEQVNKGLVKEFNEALLKKFTSVRSTKIKLEVVMDVVVEGVVDNR